MLCSSLSTRLACRRLAPERWKMRSLLLPALSVLSVGTDVSPGCYGMLAPASYLLGDLQQKLAAVLAPPKRPSFLRPAAAAAKLQPDVASLTVAEVLAAVRPVLGPLRRHLDTAVIAVSEGLQDDYMEREDRKCVRVVGGLGSRAGPGLAGSRHARESPKEQGMRE